MRKRGILSQTGLLLLAVCFSLCACVSEGAAQPNDTSSTDLHSDPSSATNSDSAGTVDVTSVDALFGNTPDLKCYSIEELASGEIDDPLQQYDADEYRTALEEGRVLDGVGSSWESMGATYILQDVWYEDSTANMLDNDYELKSDIKDPIYIFMKINVQNNSNAEGILFLNDVTVSAFPADYYMQGGEMCYQDHVIDPRPNNPDYAKVSLAIGQSETYTIAFETGSGFTTYSPVYLYACAWSDDMFNFDNIYIKLPTLEKR